MNLLFGCLPSEVIQDEKNYYIVMVLPQIAASCSTIRVFQWRVDIRLDLLVSHCVSWRCAATFCHSLWLCQCGLLFSMLKLLVSLRWRFVCWTRAMKRQISNQSDCWSDFDSVVLKVSLQSRKSISSTGTLDARVGVPMRMEIRDGEEIKCTDYLRSFLDAYGFRDVDTAVGKSSCFFSKERLYPIHVAAEHGDCLLVQILLEAGADPDKESSKGRTALTCALDANLCNSHENVVQLLRKYGACEPKKIVRSKLSWSQKKLVLISRLVPRAM